jgi:hypothetical protein
MNADQRCERRRIYSSIFRRLLFVVAVYPMLFVFVLCLPVFILLGTSWFVIVGAAWQSMAVPLHPWWAKVSAIAVFHILSRALLEVRRGRPDIFGLGEVIAAWLILWQALSLAPTEGLTVAVAIAGAVYLCVDGAGHINDWIARRRHAVRYRPTS